QLELLLLLKRYPERAWPVRDLARELYSNPASVETEVERLVRVGLVSEENGDPVNAYRYQPKDSLQDADVMALMEAYRDYRVRVIELIFSKPTQTMQDLADAFRLTDKSEDK